MCIYIIQIPTDILCYTDIGYSLISIWINTIRVRIAKLKVDEIIILST